MKKVYEVVAMITYRDRTQKYACATFTNKRDARRYIKENCYETASRSYYIAEATI